MRWASWLLSSRQRRLCAVGVDVGPESCGVVVLMGSPTQPDSVCCAERLSLPEDCVMPREALQPLAFGRWLSAHLRAGDYHPEVMCLSLDDACVSHHLVTLPAGLSEDDVAFQLQAEVQSMLPNDAGAVCVDYGLDTDPEPTPAEAGMQRYWVQAAPRTHVELLQQVAQAAGFKSVVVEPRRDAIRRVQQSHTFAGVPLASAALALQYDAAFGLALRAWCSVGVNFLPHRETAQRLLRRAWWLGVVVCALGGAFLAAGFALVITSVAETKMPHTSDVMASARAYEHAQKVHAQVKAERQRSAEQSRWLQTRQVLQMQSLQWSRVLSQAAQGVWVASVKQHGSHWTVQGEALSSNHAHQLVQQLSALDIWAQAPELPQLQLRPLASTTGLPVWQFRIEADLKVGV